MSTETKNQNVASGLQTINPQQLYRHMQYCMQTKRTPFIWGDPGIGKSQIIAHIAKMFNFHFEDIRLSQIDSVDLRGLPVKSYLEFSSDDIDAKNPERGPIVEWAMPDFLARAKEAYIKEGKRTIFFFDEFNSAMKNTLAAAYQLVLDRRIGCFALDEGDVIIAAGNYETNGGITTMMPTPLANRFVHYNLKVSTKQWLEFAYASGIHPYVTAHIERHKTDLHTFDDDTVNQDEKAFGTPRSWHFASDFVHTILNKEVKTNLFADDNESENFFDTKETLSNEEIMGDVKTAVAGCVGRALAQQFMASVKIGLDMPKPEKILDGEVKSIKGMKEDGDMSREYILTNSCLFELRIRRDEYTNIQKEIKDSKEKGIAIDEASEKNLKAAETHFYSSVENFVVFAKNNFGSETFIYAVVTNMIRTQNIQPHPKYISKEAFALVKEAFERASNK